MPPTYPDPLKVYFPHGGTYLAMHWWTHNERGHLALVREPKQLDPIIQKITRKHEDVQIKDVFELEVVSPPQWLIERARKDLYEEDVRDFLLSVQWDVNRAVRNGGQMPSQFTACDHTTYDCGDWEEDKPTHDTDPEHNYCKNCRDRVALANMTPEQFFHRYYDLWCERINPEEALPSIPSIGKVRHRVSQARKAPEDAELWRAYESFGHHSGGFCLEKIEDHVTNPHTTIFFFLRKDDRPDVQAKMNAVVAAVAKAAEDAKQVSREQERQRIEARKKTQTEHDKKVLWFFKEH